MGDIVLLGIIKMGFFSDLGKKTTETAGKISKETKLKLKINENKGKINDLYEAIGKKVYEKHIRENDVCIKDEIENECAQIDSLSKDIENARLEILKLNNRRLCVKCSAEIDSSAQFCPKCGEKQPVDEPTVQEEALEKLENSDITPEKEKEAEAVAEDLKEEIAEQNVTENNNESTTENNGETNTEENHTETNSNLYYKIKS